jgi:hypothetical protein
MKSQETLGKIMELLNLQDEIKLESMKLDNGTVIEAEAFEANQEVFIVTEDEKIALPVGEYTLEDGRILVVAEEGVIAEMRDGGEEAPAEEPAQEEEVEQAEEEPKEEEMSYATKEELSAAVEEMKAMIEEIKAMMSPKEEEMAEEVKEEVKEEEVEMSADEPAAKPIKHSPDTKPVEMHQFSKGAKGDTLSRIFNKLG